MPGHPHDLSDEQTETIRKRRAEGGTLEQIAKELGVHHSTVARYVEETETPEPDARYRQLAEQIRAAHEANVLDALDAAEKMDYRRMRDVMQRQNVLTQQAKGLLAAKGLYVAPRDNGTEENRKTQTFLTELANGPEEQASTTTNGGEKRAGSRAT
jgi:IS30 family transposase